MSARGNAALALVTAWAVGTCGDTCPNLPAELDAAFAKGTVCMPTSVNTSGSTTEPPRFPMRFDLCLYDCVSIVSGTTGLIYFWQCPGGQCEMVVLATARLERTKDECDGCKLEDPPQNACVPTSVTFMVEVPSEIDLATMRRTFPARNFTVRIAYVTLSQAAKIEEDIRAGMSPAQAVAGGGGRSDKRAFSVSFDPKHPAVSDASALGGADCHAIALP